MPRCRYVNPDTTRYDLSDGDWIDLKRQLTAGERWAINAAGVTEEEGPGGAVVQKCDLAQRYVAIRLGWIANWSFVDGDGNQTAVTGPALEALDLDTIAEIDQAIIRHTETQRARKNAMSPGSAGA